MTYRSIAVKAALKSGRFIKRSVGRISEISYKGRDNIVTDVDKKAEALIIRDILAAFPDHSVLSEESAPRAGIGNCRWIVDPLDGTTNFAHAFPFFCVSIGLEIGGVMRLGVVYDPVREELFVGERGKGAYLNNRKIRVSKTAKLAGSFLATGFSYGLKSKDRNIANFSRLLTRTLAIRRAGSAALDLCYVACGRFDGFWEMDLHPWDSAAGMVIVTEAGGKVTKFNGSPYSPYEKDILASNGMVHDGISKEISSKR